MADWLSSTTQWTETQSFMCLIGTKRSTHVTTSHTMDRHTYGNFLINNALPDTVSHVWVYREHSIINKIITQSNNQNINRRVPHKGTFNLFQIVTSDRAHPHRPVTQLTSPRCVARTAEGVDHGQTQPFKHPCGQLKLTCYREEIKRSLFYLTSISRHFPSACLLCYNSPFSQLPSFETGIVAAVTSGYLSDKMWTLYNCSDQ